MIRIMDIPVSEIAIDPQAASERLNAAIGRHGGMSVSGLGRAGDRLLVFLEPLSEFAPLKKWRFAPFEGFAVAEISGEVMSRYGAGFSTAGLFTVGNMRWGLFGTEAEDSL